MLKFSYPFFRCVPSFSCYFVSGLSILVVVGCACSDPRTPEAKKRKESEEIAEAGILPSKSGVMIERAIAHIKSFKENQISGEVAFSKVDNGIKIVADIEGLSPGQHGFHIHEFGDCREEGKKVGDHFNPTHAQHAGPDDAVRHIGDLGNLIANEQGRAHYERTDSLIRFEGENSIIGRSLIIHADSDDYKTQPSGASGVKIACGVIEAVIDK